MRKKIACSILISIVFFVAGVVSSSMDVYATQTRTWSETFPGTFANRMAMTVFRGTPLTVWYPGLADPYVQVQYGVRARNVETGTILNDGATVNEGDVIRFEFIPYHYQQIAWTGTGHSNDTPYGEWRANADSPPIRHVAMGGESLGVGWDGSEYQLAYCEEKDFVNHVEWRRGVDVYIPLVVHPPEKVVHVEGMDCSNPNANGNVECIVTDANNVSAVLTFEETFGHFYHRWKQKNWGANECFGSDVPMRYPVTELRYHFTLLWYVSAVGPTFTLRPPAQIFTYAFEVEEPELPPNAPELDGPREGYVHDEHIFSVVGTHPDDEDLLYCIDWNMNGSIDECVNQEQFVDSGTEVMFPHTWSAIGEKEFQALAKTKSGLISDWSLPHSIRIIPKPDPELLVSCDADSNSVNVDEDVTFIANVSGGRGVGSYTYSWAGVCSGYDETCTESFSEGGTSYTARLTVSSGNQTVGPVGCSVDVVSKLEVSDCHIDPLAPRVNDEVTFRIDDILGGIGEYTYEWIGCEAGLGDQECRRTFSTAGVGKSVGVLVRSGNQQKLVDCSVDVAYPLLQVDSCITDEYLFDINEEVMFMVNVSGGSGSYEYEWGAPCTGAGATCEQGFSSSGNQEVTVTIRDSETQESGSVICSVYIRGFDQESGLPTPPPPRYEEKP